MVLGWAKNRSMTASPIIVKPLAEYTLVELADMFGDAQLLVDQRDNAIARRDKYRDEINRRYAAAPALEEQFFEGSRWDVRLTARRFERRFINATATFKALHLTAMGFVRMVFDAGYVPLCFVEERLGKAKAAELMTEEQTGYRTVKAVPRPQPRNAA